MARSAIARSKARANFDPSKEARGALFTLRADQQPVSIDEYLTEMERRRFWKEEALAGLEILLITQEAREGQHRNLELIDARLLPETPY